MCVGDISKGFTVVNIKTRLDGYAHDFTVDFNTNDVDMCLMK